MTRQRKLVLLGGAAASMVLAGVAVAGCGHWLSASDAPVRSDAIVVLGGHMPYRAMEAAELYNKDYAPEVWLLAGDVHPEHRTMSRLGVEIVPEHVYNFQLLTRLGVPGSAVRVLQGGVHTTREEILRIRSELDRRGLRNVLIVTSGYHARRVKLTWRQLAGQQQRALVCRTAAGSSHADRWWSHPADVYAVAHEILSIMNTWAGFPLQAKPS